MLTLKGAQGIGKDRWLRKLCLDQTEFYKEGFLDPSNKDHRLSQLTHIFWNVSELDGTTNKREAAELKCFLTASTVSERKAYGKFESSGYSIISFCASVNEDCFLGDQTGNRRFLVLPINFNINMENEVDIQQVYAQAKNLYDQGVSPYFSLEEISETNSINDEYVHQDKIDEIAAAIVSGETPMTANQIFESFFYHSFKKSDPSKLGRLLKKKGISTSRPLVGGIKLTVYKVNKEKLSFD